MTSHLKPDTQEWLTTGSTYLGNFTTNERRAAWTESFDQEYAWRQKVVANAIAKYDGTGKLTEFFTAALEHYKDLSAIEQAQYPEVMKRSCRTG